MSIREEADCVDLDTVKWGPSLAVGVGEEIFADLSLRLRTGANP